MRNGVQNRIVLRLFIVGSSLASEMVLKNLKELIAQESKTIFELEVIDVVKHPQLAEENKIMAIPTLIRKLPAPIRKIVGDLSNREKVLLALNLMPHSN